MGKDLLDPTFSLTHFVDFLKSDPSILKRNHKPVDITLATSDLRKRYTEFYRIRVDDGRQEATHYWIRHLKNKPETEIRLALANQFSVMEKLHAFFESRSHTQNHFTCSEPIALLPDRHLLITKECHGTLMNDYLLKKIPFIAKPEILSHCRRVGQWLALFHRCFRSKVSKTELESKTRAFETRHGRPLSEGCNFVSRCHHDYSPRNIFVAPNSVEVIDFVAVKMGLPDEDILFFKNYIRKAKFNMLYSTGYKEMMIDAFWEGYQAGRETT